MFWGFFCFLFFFIVRLLETMCLLKTFKNVFIHSFLVVFIAVNIC